MNRLIRPLLMLVLKLSNNSDHAALSLSECVAHIETYLNGKLTEPELAELSLAYTEAFQELVAMKAHRYDKMAQQVFLSYRIIALHQTTLPEDLQEQRQLASLAFNEDRLAHSRELVEAIEAACRERRIEIERPEL